ncbi:MAG TPA: hypothetical protein VMV69_10365 [Pirellulales bacterium]|nr:hypothetical protein [Pirellulales bacterium]
MMHKDRRWCVAPVATAEQLAHDLTERTWCCCNGFELCSYMFLNDATCGDGAQEYAVVTRRDDGSFLQVESVTFSWCDYFTALDIIQKILRGECDQETWVRAVAPHLESSEQHGRCPHCA